MAIDTFNYTDGLAQLTVANIELQTIQKRVLYTLTQALPEFSSQILALIGRAESLNQSESPIIISDTPESQPLILLLKAGWEALGLPITTRPHEHAQAELAQWVGYLSNHPLLKDLYSESPNLETEIHDRLLDHLMSITGQKINRDSIAQLLSKTSISADFAYLYKSLIKVKTAGAAPNWIFTAEEVMLCPDQETLQTLEMIRLFGLVPFEVVTKLRNAQIVSVGASVASGVVTALQRMGAENITVFDSGQPRPTTHTRMAGSMANLAHLGDNKAQLLVQSLIAVNPYGDFKAIPADLEMMDSALQSALENADLCIEVVDSPTAKIRIREFIRRFLPNLPILFIVDSGSNSPTVTLELSDNNQFGQGLSQTDLEMMNGQLTASELEATILDNPSLQLLATIPDKVGAILNMVGDQIPPEHLLQVALSYGNPQTPPLYLGLAQTPIASMTSGSMGAQLFGLFLAEHKITDKTFTPNTLPQSYYDFDETDRATIQQIFEALKLKL